MAVNGKGRPTKEQAAEAKLINDWLAHIANYEKVYKPWETRAEKIIKRLPRKVVLALTAKGSPIPDSLWFGEFSHLRESVDGVRWRWSPLGEEVRALLLAPPTNPAAPHGE